MTTAIRRSLTIGVVAALAATTFLLGGALSGESNGDAQAARSKVQVLLQRGMDEYQRAQTTGDPSHYVGAAAAFRRALALEPNNLAATVELGALELSRHRFRRALGLGRRAVALAPASARGYGVLGDALLELGRYEEAFRTFNRMTALKPSVSSYARISYARELVGDIAGAAAAMKLAADAAAGAAGNQAWAYVQLGKLLAAHGRSGEAVRNYRTALRLSPGYVDAYDALARIKAGRGWLASAISHERRAVEGLPHADHFFTLGDFYSASGKHDLAAEAYRDAERAFAEEADAGARVELELALFLTDRGEDLPRALSIAQAARAARPSVDGDDVLAWALARNGRCGDALRYSKLALRLGTRDALKYFHRGMIERCLGETQSAKRWFERALRLNPHFSTLWAPLARSYAR